MLGGLFGAIGKIFTPALGAATKVGSGVLGVAASTFTAGAATGAPSLISGGFGSAIQGLFSGGGVLGNMVSGAMQQAAYGAISGGIGGMLTGSGFGQGAMQGAMGGAVMGGVSTGLGAAFGGQGPGAGGWRDPGGSVRMAPGAEYSSMDGGPGGTPMPPQRPADLGTGQGTAPAMTGEARNTGLGAILENPMVGNLIAGVGQGMSAKAQADATRQLQEGRQAHEIAMDERTRDNYRVNPNALQTGRRRREYDPAQKRIVTVG